MKLLTRSIKPTCLNKFKHGVDNWGDVGHTDKQEIWSQLETMQGEFCSYCECLLKKRHIEHFVDKGRTPIKTFDWNNLFGSCDNRSRCGHYKDSNKVNSYDSINIIKPDSDNASDYLVFITDGSVRSRIGLIPIKKFKASETIRVFNLNLDTSLVNSRKVAIRYIKPNIEALYEMSDDLSIEEFTEFLNEELTSLKGSEYQTALEHAWRFKLDF